MLYDLMSTAAAARWPSNSATPPSGTVSWWPSGPAWKTARVCYEPQRLDWLPLGWVIVHVVITDGQGQKVPFQGGTCAVKLLLRRRGGYFRLWDTSTEALTSSWWPPPSRRWPGLGTSEDMASGLSSNDCSVRLSLCSKALCWEPLCAWPATCSEERPWNRPSKTAWPPW